MASLNGGGAPAVP
jgi:hypothetical protein